MLSENHNFLLTDMSAKFLNLHFFNLHFLWTSQTHRSSDIFWFRNVGSQSICAAI